METLTFDQVRVERSRTRLKIFLRRWEVASLIVSKTIYDVWAQADIVTEKECATHPLSSTAVFASETIVQLAATCTVRLGSVRLIHDTYDEDDEDDEDKVLIQG